MKKSILAVLITCSFTLSAQVSFKKVVIDPTFVSAGVTTADIDKDGLEDIVAGDVWYKAPDWERFEIRPLGKYYPTKRIPTLPTGSGAGYYSRSIGNYTSDIDGDGWLDVITFNSQGSPCYWYRNPAGNFDELWEEYMAIELFHNESPQIVDLFGDGNPVVLAGNHLGDDKYSLGWFEIPEDPTQLWEHKIIGHPDNFDLQISWGKPRYFAPGGMTHGLGIGDIDGDGITDVVTAQGWYKGPENARSVENWAFNSFRLDSLADPEKIYLLFAQMFVADFDQDGDNDIISGSAHAYGLWWFEQVQNNKKIEFVKHEITMEHSQLHAMNAADFDGDGVDEYVTGKRFYAHLGRDPGAEDPATIVYVDPVSKKKKSVEMKVSLVDDDSGSGTQIWITDINKDGKPDLVTSNKKGTNLFVQE